MKYLYSAIKDSCLLESGQQTVASLLAGCKNIADLLYNDEVDRNWNSRVKEEVIQVLLTEVQRRRSLNELVPLTEVQREFQRIAMDSACIRGLLTTAILVCELDSTGYPVTTYGLQEAMKRDYYDLFAELLKRRGRVANDLLLHHACESIDSSHSRYVQLLLANGYDVDVNSFSPIFDRYRVPLRLAVAFNNFNTVHILVQAGATILRDILPSACVSGNIDIVRLFLKDRTVRSWIDRADRHGNSRQTALQVAISNNHLAIVQLLIDHGCSLNQSNKKQTPIRTACRNPNLSMMRLLLRSGANPKSFDSQDDKATQMMFDAMAEEGICMMPKTWSPCWSFLLNRVEDHDLFLDERLVANLLRFQLVERNRMEVHINWIANYLQRMGLLTRKVVLKLLVSVKWATINKISVVWEINH